jgi:hypothetical protein
MATYKFPQFQVEITTDIMEVNLNTISDKAVDKLLSVDIKLIANDATFGLRAEDMPYVDTWEDTDVPNMVNNWLNQFAI